MSVATRAVAAVAVRRIKHLFGEHFSGMVKLDGFTELEISEMLSLLDTWQSDRVRLVVIANEAWDELSKRNLLEPGKSATWYRNTEKACVFFEAADYSDAQGLRNVTNLTDGNLLGEERTDIAAGLQTFEAVWLLHRGEKSVVPEALRLVVEDVLTIHVELDKQLALRRWVQFADEVCERLAEEPVVDGRRARRAIGSSLPSLGMFADAAFVDLSGNVPRRRRLFENRLAADDRTKSGREIDRDELAEIVETIVFRNGHDVPLVGDELQEVRTKLRAYLLSYQDSETKGIDYGHWTQLFEHTRARSGLGTKILDELEEDYAERVDEFIQLDLVAALDAKDVEAAQAFLDAEPIDSDDIPLSDLVSPHIRKGLVRIANPTTRGTDQPLRYLLRLLYGLREGEGEDGGGVIRLEPRGKHGAESADRLSRALFALLYGPTLAKVVAQTASEEWSFEVAPELLDPKLLSSWLKQDDSYDDDDEYDASELDWEALRLQLRWENEHSGVEHFEWRPRENPGLIALARILMSAEQWKWSTPANEFDDWCEKIADTGELPGTEGDEARHELTQEWLTLRRGTFQSVLRDGFDAATLSQYVEYWSKLLERLQLDHIPSGAPDPVVAEFLQVDMHRGPDGAPTLLATHPLRLRWLQAQLDSMERYLADAWLGKLRLNRNNDSLFFDRLARISPHEQPSILCDDGHVYVAVREASWHERFEVVKTRDRTLTDWLADLDDSSLDEIAAALGTYVDAHPYKSDGLHLYFAVRHGGARTINRVMQRFSSQNGLTGRRHDMQLTIHVACPSSEYGAVSAALSSFIDPSERARRDFPRIRVLFHDWPDGQPTPPIEHVEHIDVAIIPNLFSASTRCQEQTQVAGKRRGTFNPLLDRTTIREAAGTGLGAKNVSRILLPETSDALLETWSTVNVRHYRSSKVNQDGADNDIDFMTMTVAVSDGEAFFGQIHERAHWVITLDAFVGREQIEALAHRPQVITIKPGLGKGEAYTLVVSSKVGKSFIKHRLARRIRQQLGDTLELDAEAVAEQLYEQAKELAPGTLLRALGLGRIAQELVGLVVTRNLVSQFDPVRLGRNGFESWIALDEHPTWFAGGQNKRADLLRVVGTMNGGAVHLSFMAVEAKMRAQNSVRKAEQQVDATCELCRDAFASITDALSFDDGDIWRRALLDAIRQSAREVNSGRQTTFRARFDGKELKSLPDEFVDAIRNGNYESTVSGFVCTIAENGAQAFGKSPNEKYRWLRASTEEIARVLRALAAGEVLYQDPIPNESAVEPRVLAPHVESLMVEATEPTVDVVSAVERGMSLEQRLARYQQILDAFAEFGVDVRADEHQPVQEGPGFFVFRVVPGYKVLPSMLQNKIDILKLKLGLPQDRQPRTYIDQGAVVFEVPKSQDERYDVDADTLWGQVSQWPTDRLAIAIGEDVTGAPVWVDFSSSNTPHLLIGGITGSGKSVALETILVGLTRHYSPDQLKISVVDPKGTELQFLERTPHLDREIGIYPEEAIELLDEMVAEMESRYAKLRDKRVKKLSEYNEMVEASERMPWRVVVLDEFADLTSEHTQKKSIEHSLQRLAQKARACGIHVIVATQKPSAEVISTTVRSNLGAQLALRVKTATDSRIIMDETGAEALAGYGDAFLRSAEGIRRLQCARIVS